MYLWSLRHYLLVMRNPETRAKYLQANKEKIAAQKKARAELKKDEIKQYQKQWQAANKERLRSWAKAKKATDPLFRLKCNIKNLISDSLKSKGYPKLSRTEQILGCTYAEFKIYLESKFEPWMSWENKAMYNGQLNYGWDIDHIIPLATAKNEAEILRLNHYTNLQPLCSYTNRHIKRDK